MSRKASCCCGALTIEVDGDPAINAVCHCSDCKRRTGSAFGRSAYFKNDQIVDHRGAATLYPVTTADTDQKRYFCSACGTTLYWTSDYFEGMTGIAGGCFTDDPLPEPTLSVSNDGRCAWVSLPDNWSTALGEEQV